MYIKWDWDLDTDFTIMLFLQKRSTEEFFLFYNA